MDDYIKREDAIEAFDPQQRRDWYTPWIVETLEDLPPADVAPVRHEEDGTLLVTVGDCETVGRVIVRNEQGHFCRVFYMGDGDEEPVRHGHWEVIDAEEPRRYGCSECKRLSWHMENYCPNCGAKMDREETNE